VRCKKDDTPLAEINCLEMVYHRQGKVPRQPEKEGMDDGVWTTPRGPNQDTITPKVPTRRGLGGRPGKKEIPRLWGER